MAPGTHAFVSWWTANVLPLSRRDRSVVFLAGLLPDLDGLTLFYSEEAYLRYHHVLSHNLLGGLFWTAFAALFANEKRKCATLAFLCWHLHLICDYFGSGGGNRDIWVLPYLYPAVGTLTETDFTGPRWYWNPWQLELHAWPNLVVGGIAAMGWIYIAVRLDRTWFEFLSVRLDREICRVLRQFFGGQPVAVWSEGEGRFIRRSFLLVSTLALFACVLAATKGVNAG